MEQKVRLQWIAIDEVVFAQSGDLELPGARSLEGLNLRVDYRAKELVAGGPIPAAARKVVMAVPASLFVGQSGRGAALSWHGAKGSSAIYDSTHHGGLSCGHGLH